MFANSGDISSQRCVPKTPQFWPPRCHCVAGLLANVHRQICIPGAREWHIDPGVLVARLIVALEEFEWDTVRDKDGTSARVGRPEVVCHVTADGARRVG